MVSDEDNGTPVDRKAPRHSVRAAIQFRKSGYQKASVYLIDISPIGCKMELPERAVQGETVWITLPGLSAIPARVSWVRDWMAGQTAS